jgi:hypothetical protein
MRRKAGCLPITNIITWLLSRGVVTKPLQNSFPWLPSPYKIHFLKEKKMKNNLLLITVFLIGLVLGIIFQRNITIGKVIKEISLVLLKLKGEKIVEVYNLQRQEINCQEIPNNDKTMVVLIFGQSQSSNHGNVKGIASKNVYTFYQGKCYPAEDPLPGADGLGGSIWTRLGNKIINKDLYETVIFAPIALGGTKIEQWSPSGELHNRILNTIDDLNSQNLKITHLFWHQGESDSLVIDSEPTPVNVYKQHFYAMLDSIRKKGINAPIYVDVATRCYQSPGYAEIQNAQREFVNPDLGILAGINTDILGLEYRYDTCHFNEKGLKKAAEMWLEILTNKAF